MTPNYPLVGFEPPLKRKVPGQNPDSGAQAYDPGMTFGSPAGNAPEASQSDPYAPVSGRRQLFGNLVSSLTGNSQLGGLITGDTQRQRQLALETQQANLQLLRNQAQEVQTPYGPLSPKFAGPILAAETRGQFGLTGQQTAATSRENAARINKRYIAVPGVGVVDTAGENGASVIPGTSNSVPITEDNYTDLGVPSQFVGKNLPLAQAIAAQNALRFSEQPMEGSQDQYLVNRNPTSPDFGKKTSLGIGIPSLGRAVQVADPNNPGNTIYTTAAKAIQSGAQGPQSAAVQVPRQAQRASVPTKIGDQKVAFATMIQHAQLLRDAAKALNNGDTQALNGLQNDFKNAFGYSGPITAQAIADAYGGEVTNVISKGHLTDQSFAKTGKTIDPTRQNFKTIDSVLGAYQSLAQSKMNMLDQQTNNAVTSSQRPAVGTVRMRSPDGKTMRDVPAAQVPHFKSLGATIVQ